VVHLGCSNRFYLRFGAALPLLATFTDTAFRPSEKSIRLPKNHVMINSGALLATLRAGTSLVTTLGNVDPGAMVQSKFAQQLQNKHVLASALTALDFFTQVHPEPSAPNIYPDP